MLYCLLYIEMDVILLIVNILIIIIVIIIFMMVFVFVFIMRVIDYLCFEDLYWGCLFGVIISVVVICKMVVS